MTRKYNIPNTIFMQTHAEDSDRYISKARPRARSQHRSRLKMIASCKYITPDEMESTIGVDDWGINTPAFIDDEYISPLLPDAHHSVQTYKEEKATDETCPPEADSYRDDAHESSSEYTWGATNCLLDVDSTFMP
jgi:hypothetical protein